jgi:uncharacterized protein
MSRFVFALIVMPLSVLADAGLPTQPYIYVEGQAELEKPADLVTLNFSLVTHNADQAKANKDVQTKAARVLALLDASKITEKDVVAGDLTSEAEYEGGNEDSANKRGKLVGYEVRRAFSVKVRETAAFPKIVDEVLSLGGVQFHGIYASLSNQKAVENEVWEKALANARDRAEKTLSGAGMKIDSIFAISPVPVPEILPKILGGRREVLGFAASEQPQSVNPSQYRLAPVTVSQSVHVIYLISPAK